jgi:hypothetical protein
VSVVDHVVEQSASERAFPAGVKRPKADLVVFLAGNEVVAALPNKAHRGAIVGEHSKMANGGGTPQDLVPGERTGLRDGSRDHPDRALVSGTEPTVMPECAGMSPEVSQPTESRTRL